jgi:hypothetical protein
MFATGPNPRIRGMATSSHTTMLREFSAAGEAGQTGALDVEWEGARASFFFKLGIPTHLVFDAPDGRQLDGLLALDALVDELPAEFQVAPWRRAMVSEDTLHCTADELMELFATRPATTNGPTAGSNGHTAGSNGHGPAHSNGHSPEPPPIPDWLRVPPQSAEDGDQPAFGLHNFPQLQLGEPLWSVPIAELVNFELIVSHLRDTLLVLSGTSCRAAAVVTDGEIVKAVLVNVTSRLLGDAAAHALLDAPAGTLAAHRLDDPHVVAALALLWPEPPVQTAPPTPAAEAPAAPEAPAPQEPATRDLASAYVPEYAHDAQPHTRLGPEPDTGPTEAPEITDESTPAAQVDLDRAMFTLASPVAETAPEATETELVAAREATEFIAPRIEVDIDALRIELTDIAVRWLGDDDSTQVADAIAATRPGVDDFVSTIGAIGALDIPGHESAIVRAMSREMHYRAAEVLCGV